MGRKDRRDLSIGEMISFFAGEGEIDVIVADEEGIELVSADRLVRTSAHQKMDGYGGRLSIICKILVPRGHRPWHVKSDLHENDMVPCGESKVRDLMIENDKVVWTGEHYYCPICEASG